MIRTRLAKCLGLRSVAGAKTLRAFASEALQVASEPPATQERSPRRRRVRRGHRRRRTRRPRHRHPPQAAARRTRQRSQSLSARQRLGDRLAHPLRQLLRTPSLRTALPRLEESSRRRGFRLTAAEAAALPDGLARRLQGPLQKLGLQRARGLPAEANPQQRKLHHQFGSAVQLDGRAGPGSWSRRVLRLRC